MGGNISSCRGLFDKIDFFRTYRRDDGPNRVQATGHRAAGHCNDNPENNPHKSPGYGDQKGLGRGAVKRGNCVLGVFLAYGIMGPFASRVKGVVEEDAHFYQLIREVLIANLHRHPPNICLEVGRQNTPHHVRPTFANLEGALRGLKQDAA